MNLIRVVAMTLAPILMLLSGCAVGPNYKSPVVTVPESFDGSEQTDVKRWWESFGDEGLNRLIERAVESNLDVQLACARVREARAQLGISTAPLFPTLTGTGSYTRSQQRVIPAPKSNDGSLRRLLPTATLRPPANGNNGGLTLTPQPITLGGNGQPSATIAPGSLTLPGGATTPPAVSLSPTTPKGASIPRRQDLFQAGFDASWEIDVFGGTRRAIEAAQADLDAQNEARRDALVTLLSELARNYMILRGVQSELAIVEQNIVAQQDTLDLTQSRFDAGIATDLDVARAEAQVQSTQSQLPTLRTQIEQAIHRLGVLLAEEPMALADELASRSPLPVGPPHVPAGLPSDLLRRRPDVRHAERQIAAATARIGVATADLFPKFTLTGSMGFQSNALKSMLNSNNFIWSFGPSISWNLFSGGRVLANIQVQNEQEQEALIQYRQAVLQALQEVNDALVAYEEEQSRRDTLRKAVASNQRAVDMAKQLNDAGVVDFLNVLSAQLSLYVSQDQLAQSEQAVSVNLVALYKALGGGWEDFEPLATANVSGPTYAALTR